jgi:uncharacterized membrane protein
MVKTRQRHQRSARWTLSLVVAAVASAVVATAAYAFTDYVSQTVYANGLRLGPGGYTQTGFNYRTENNACRQDNSGRMSVSYINTSEVRVTYSGVVWTNCNSLAAVSITNNGYYRARCTNEGTIVFPVACWAWNYSP